MHCIGQHDFSGTCWFRVTRHRIACVGMVVVVWRGEGWGGGVVVWLVCVVFDMVLGYIHVYMYTYIYTHPYTHTHIYAAMHTHPPTYNTQ